MTCRVECPHSGTSIGVCRESTRVEPPRERPSDDDFIRDDGEVIRKDGLFVPADLAALNACAPRAAEGEA